MNTFKKTLAVFLCVLMLFSVMTVGITTAFATGEVNVTATSQQSLFANSSRTYKIGDIFEFVITWQSDNLLRNGLVETLLNNKGLKIVEEQVNPKITSATTNISEECQNTWGLVTMNYSTLNGMDFATEDYIVKYRVQVLSTAGAEEVINVDFRDANGALGTDDLATDVSYIKGGVVTPENKDSFAVGGILGDVVAVATEATTPPYSETESSETESSEAESSERESSENSSSETESKETESSEIVPTETESSETESSETLPTETESKETESSETLPTETESKETESSETESTAPSTDETETTEPSTDETEDTQPATKAPSLKKTSVSLKAGKTYKIAVKNSNGAKIAYRSDKTKIATVDKKGNVTALQKGTAKITVKVGSKKLTCKVKVTSSPKLSKKAVKIKKGQTVTLKLTGKASAIKNSYKNAKTAKITSKTNATRIKIKGVKKGTSTVKVKVNKVVTLKVKVTVK